MSDLYQAEISRNIQTEFPLPEVPVQLLVTLCCVGKEKSFAHAAAILCLPYSVVTQQITRLEKLIGLPVLKKSTGKIRLTDLGMRLVDLVQSHTHDIQKQSQSVLKENKARALEQVSKSGPNLQVEMDLWGMAASLKPYLNVLRDLPFNLNFVTKNARGVQMPDVVCHLGHAPLDGYDSTLLFGEEIMAVVSAKYPTPDGGFDDEGLQGEPLLRLGHSDHRQDWSAYLGLDPDQNLPGIEKEAYTSFSQYLRAIKAGRGVGIGLVALLQPEIDAGHLKLATPRKMWRNRACYIGINKRCKDVKIAQDFANVLKTIFEPVVLH